jgi:hypothetical protein
VIEGNNGFTFNPASIDGLADLLGVIADLPEQTRIAMAHASKAIISQWSPTQFAAQVASAAKAALGSIDRRTRA